ncbi:MAG TPA: SpoIID/LytB domain-containing protein [Candidatus Dojkabacteria bacterium]|nr:SpoIID/LytB domain-containing protein [Candidatus Dojkabacteria bacterium]
MGKVRAIQTVLFFVVTFSYLITFLVFPIFAQTVGDLEKEVDQKSQEIKDKESTLQKIQKEIEEINRSSVSIDEKIRLMDKQIEKINEYVGLAEKDIKVKEGEIKKKEEELKKEQESLDQIASMLYKSSRFSFWEVLFSGGGDDSFFTGVLLKRISGFSYVERMKLLSQNFAEIKQGKLDIEEEKESLENEIVGLEKSQADLVKQKSVLAAQAVSKRNLSSKIGGDISVLKGEVSKLQEAILIAKSSGGIINATDVPGDPGNLNSKAGFLTNAGSGNFAVFAFGAYTHRNGMSQYGAYGRAIAGQSAEQILAAYYPAETLNKAYAEPSVIYVHGTNEYGQTFNCEAFTMDEYLKRLYEVPSSWPSAVLRAQAVAARSYAIRYIKNTGNRCNGKAYICPTQSCQVVKREKNAAAWQSAVDYTKKWVLTGGPGNFQFSSTSGGYLNTSGWDTTNKQGGVGNWVANAYEGAGKGNSPWFYRTWPTFLNGSICQSSKKDKTGNNKNYLSNSEMADILNVYLVNKGDGVKGNVDYSRLIPVTINDCPIAGLNGNPYSKDDLKNLLNNPVREVNSVVAAASAQGQTSSITFYTNRGTITLSGVEFETVYNLRAPGYLQIPPQGNNVTFINIEKK